MYNMSSRGSSFTYFGAIAAALLLYTVNTHVEGNPIQEMRWTNLVGTHSETINQHVDEFVRSKRSPSDNLQEFRDKLLERLNDYRRGKNLPLFVIDPVLEDGAQAWALEETITLTMSHSCEECRDYAEILGKRRASKPIPQGLEAGDWVYSSLFDDGEKTFAGITDDEEILYVGFGIEFIRNPEDRTYHSYIVARFARPPQH